MIKEMMAKDEAYDDATDRMAGTGEGPSHQAEPGGGAPRDEAPQLKVIRAAMRVLYHKSTSDGIVKMLQSAEPPKALAQTAIFVLRILFNESKGSLPPDLLLGAVEQVVSLLAELADAAGVQIDPQVVAQVTEQVRQIVQQKLQGGQQRAAPQQMQGGGMIQQAMGGM